jgi:hypothetical protein
MFARNLVTNVVQPTRGSDGVVVGDVLLSDGDVYARRIIFEELSGADGAIVNGLGSSVSTHTCWVLREKVGPGILGGTMEWDMTLGPVWQVRMLNDEKAVGTFPQNVQLMGNSGTIRVLPGGYDIHASAPASSVTGHQVKFVNITTGEEDPGTSESADGLTNTRSVYIGVIKVPDTVPYYDFQLQHAASSKRRYDGMGRPSNTGAHEIYATVRITQYE